jgi:hypothetical protein
MQFRCLLRGPADDNAGGEYQPVVLKKLQLLRRGIDDDAVARHEARQPTQPFESHRELAGAPLRRLGAQIWMLCGASRVRSTGIVAAVIFCKAQI